MEEVAPRPRHGAADPGGHADASRSRSAWRRGCAAKACACAVLNARNDAEEAAVIAARRSARRGHHLHQHGRARHRHPAGRAGRGAARRSGRAGRPLRDRHQPPREPPHRPPAPRPRRPPGRSRRVALLRQPGGRPARALRPARPAAGARGPGAAGRSASESPLVRREIARAQRIVEGQNFEIRRTLWRYASAIEDQRRAVQERRTALLLGDEEPDLWREDARYGALAAAVGEAALQRRGARGHARPHRPRAGANTWRSWPTCAKASTWCGWAARTRSRASRSRPRRRSAGWRTSSSVGARRAGRDRRSAADGTWASAALAVKGPSSTWTYLVNDDPFRDQLGAQLTGPGRTTFAMGAAVFAAPLLILLGLADRLWRKRPQRRSTLEAQRLSQDNSTARQSPPGGPP